MGVKEVDVETQSLNYPTTRLGCNSDRCLKAHLCVLRYNFGRHCCVFLDSEKLFSRMM